MTGRPIRFGALVVPVAGAAAAVRQAQKIEALGFDLVVVDDHVSNPAMPTAPWAEVWTTLAAMAAATDSIRLGSMVSNAILRHPALLARQALSVDDISAGRLEIGLGSGYAATDFAGVGRVPESGPGWGRRFRAAVSAIRALVAGDPVAHDPAGAAFGIDGLTMREPRTSDESTPPITIAADGPIALDVAAEFGDRWVSFGGWGLDTDRILQLTAERSRLLDERCAAHGRDPAEVGRTLLAGSQAVNSDPLWTGVDRFEDFVGRAREIGIDTVVVYWPPHRFATDVDREVVDSVIAEAMPRLRAGGTT